MYFQLLRGGNACTHLTPMRRLSARKALTYRTPVLKWSLCVQTCNLEHFGRRVDQGFVAGSAWLLVKLAFMLLSVDSLS
jgi:hypothetical protein